MEQKIHANHAHSFASRTQRTDFDSLFHANVLPCRVESIVRRIRREERENQAEV